MFVAFDTEQAETLRELISSQLKQLRTETARTDSHDYREMLHRREQILEQLLSKLEDHGRPTFS